MNPEVQRQLYSDRQAAAACCAATLRLRTPLIRGVGFWMQLFIGLLLTAQGTLAQPVKLQPASVAGLGKGTAPPAGSLRSAGASGDLVAQLQFRLADAQAELNRVLASLNESTNLPPGATAAEAIQYRSALQRLVRTYQLHLDDLATLEASRLRQEELSRTIKAWSGFPEPPPYSVLLVDELRDSLQSLNERIKAAEITGEVIGKFLGEAQAMMKDSEESLRRLDEQAEGAKDVGVMTRLTWQRKLEQARSRGAVAAAGSFETKRQIASGELAEVRQRLVFTQRRLDLAARQVRFPQADFDRVMSDLAAEQRGLEHEIQQAETELDARQNALVEARDALRKSLQEQAGAITNATLPRHLQDVVEVRDIERQTSVQTLSVLRQLLEGVGTEHQMWQTRFAVSTNRNPADLQAASQRLARGSELIQAARPYYRQQIEAVANQVNEEKKRLLNQGDAPAGSALTRQRIQSYQQREAVFNRALQGLEKRGRAVARWQEALDFNRQTLPATMRVRALFSEASTLVSKLWNLEVFVVEDTITVDGQPITGRRGVTLGKIVSAILILAVGYWISDFVAGLIERLVRKRLKVELNQANLIRRWVRVVLVLGLIVFSLVSVKIPLTVFAFAGGALAIGLGFGTQNLLKNFISGIVILFERPFRVGDVLAVGAHTGLVTGIGIRSSVIQLWDGTETLIPNSALLENSLTNWTYSNRTVRFSVTVGVAYGSDTRRVAQLLAEVAGRHGQVEKDPKPQVLFTEFADSVLTFELRYWVHVLQHNAAQISSDLRHMINGAFSEEGIVIAYPQRDVHLKADKPIAVQVLPHRAGIENPAPATNALVSAAAEGSGIPVIPRPGAHPEQKG